jgi:hypothetical protein
MIVNGDASNSIFCHTIIFARRRLGLDLSLPHG